MTSLLFFHILFFALWLGAAATLPFWGNRMNRADHLHTVLGIVDTVFLLKCIFIMGGLMITLATGFMLAHNYEIDFSSGKTPDWLQFSIYISALIFINSWIIFFFLFYGRRGHRTLMRTVPPIGYTNIFLIILVALLMVKKPSGSDLYQITGLWISLIVIANLINLIAKTLRRNRLSTMSGQDYVANYFGLMNAEKMTDMLKLFDDKIIFNDPFATGSVNGILQLEKFFQKLGDQFETIKIEPKNVEQKEDHIFIQWEANGVTQNGEPLVALRGTNKMARVNGKIARVDIDFDLAQLPKVQLVNVAAL